MSFGEYLNTGATCTKMSRNGVNPRPAGLFLQHFIVKICGTWLEPKIKVTPMWFSQNSQIKAERLEPSEVEPKSRDNRTTQDPIQLEEQHGPRD